MIPYLSNRNDYSKCVFITNIPLLVLCSLCIFTSRFICIAFLVNLFHILILANISECNEIWFKFSCHKGNRHEYVSRMIKKIVSIAFGISFLREIKNRKELYISFIQTYLSSVMKTQWRLPKLWTKANRRGKIWRFYYFVGYDNYVESQVLLLAMVDGINRWISISLL